MSISSACEPHYLFGDTCTQYTHKHISIWYIFISLALVQSLFFEILVLFASNARRKHKNRKRQRAYFQMENQNVAVVCYENMVKHLSVHWSQWYSHSLSFARAHTYTTQSHKCHVIRQRYHGTAHSSKKNEHRRPYMHTHTHIQIRSLHMGHIGDAVWYLSQYLCAYISTWITGWALSKCYRFIDVIYARYGYTITYIGWPRKSN